MKHGNTKMDLSPLETMGAVVEVQSSHIYSLKTRLRQLGYKKKNVKVEDLGANKFSVERIA